jgi:hypothetical protein
LFKSIIFDQIKYELGEIVLEEIRKWRNSEEVEWDVLYTVVESFSSITIFENEVIEKSTVRKGSLKWGGKQDVDE